MINGTSIFNHSRTNGSVFVIGAPRSGNHWVNYIISELTGERSFVHHTFDEKRDSEKLILVIRNPKECIVRNCQGIHNRNKLEIGLCERIEKAFGDEEVMGSIAKLVQRFDEFACEKLLVYYEDLITDFFGEIKRIADFIGYDCTEFINSYDEHKTRSLQNYRDKFMVSVTEGLKENYHSKTVDNEYMIQIEKMILGLPCSIRKYFSRYITEEAYACV